MSSESKYRIAIVGQREAIAGFALLGIDVVSAQSAAEAVEALHRLKRATQTDASGKERSTYAIIFLSEDLASALTPEDERKLSRGALPAIIPLPSHRGPTGYGLARLRRIVERAIGSDILQ